MRPPWKQVVGIVLTLAAVGYGMPTALVTVLCLLGVNIQEFVYVHVVFVGVLATLFMFMIIVARLVSGQRRLHWIGAVDYLDTTAPPTLK